MDHDHVSTSMCRQASVVQAFGVALHEQLMLLGSELSSLSEMLPQPGGQSHHTPLPGMDSKRRGRGNLLAVRALVSGTLSRLELLDNTCR